MAVKRVEEFTVDNVTYVGGGYWYKDNESMTLTFQGDGFKVETKLSIRDYKSLAKRMASIVKEMEGVEVESD